MAKAYMVIVDESIMSADDLRRLIIDGMGFEPVKLEVMNAEGVDVLTVEEARKVWANHVADLGRPEHMGE